jgi:hypothetical protein
MEKYIATHHDFLVSAIRTKLLTEYKHFIARFRSYVCFMVEILTDT